MTGAGESAIACRNARSVLDRCTAPPPSGSGRTPPGRTRRARFHKPASERLFSPPDTVCSLPVTRRTSAESSRARAASGAAATLAGAWPFRCMSMLPRKCAPSAIATLGETMSPSTDPLSRISTDSLALMLPVSSPQTTTAFAKTCALMRPPWPMVSV